MIKGESDIDYFQSQLVDCRVNESSPELLAIFANALHNRMEDVLEEITKEITRFGPRWIYIAVNKYLITTDQDWPNLTEDYDRDLINVLNAHLFHLNYCALTESYIKDDHGQYFNFCHPTTNIFYERTDSFSQT